MTNPASPSPIFQFHMPVRWRDLDALNHVNNQIYLGFLEEARVQWLQGLLPDWANSDSAPVMAAVQAGYRKPILWPSSVVVEMYLEKIGNSSLTISHRIVDAADASSLYCDGHVVLVWIDKTTGKSAPVPQVVREAVDA